MHGHHATLLGLGDTVSGGDNFLGEAGHGNDRTGLSGGAERGTAGGKRTQARLHFLSTE